MKDRFILSALAVSFALVSTPYVTAQTISPRFQPPLPKSPIRAADSRVTALPVQKFKLLSAGTGWVLTGDKILMTTDNGAHWKDISPPNPERNGIADVFFLNGHDGWAMFFKQSELPEDGSFSVTRTADGGSSWSTSTLPQWKGRPPTGSGTIIFADKLHGWMSFDNSANTSNTSSVLYASVDGGRTWHETKGGTEGSLRGMVAVTDKEIWALGTGEFSNELDVSRDGGDSFTMVELPMPKEIGSAYVATYGLPKFEDDRNGYMAVEYGGPSGSPDVTVFFVTHDGGHTWVADQRLSNFGGGEVDGADAENGLWIVPSLPKGNQTPVLTKVSSKEENSFVGRDKAELTGCHASFISENEGWVSCEGRLQSTIDGGTTWADIRPRTRQGVLTTEPVSPPKVTVRDTETIFLTPQRARASPLKASDQIPRFNVSEHVGFDISQFISEDDMQKWWDTSPYFDAIFYFPATSHGMDKRFSPGWVADILAQGWGLIPTYVGYQSDCACAPKTKTNQSTTYPTCNRYKHQIDPKPEKASDQGAEEADKAMETASEWGLSQGVMYLDVEGFDDANGGDDPGVQIVDGKQYYCSASVQSYVDGFISEIHAQGATAGIYASASNVAADIEPENPDDIWIAGGKRGVTVWSQGYNISDASWPEVQRIHQYEEEKIEQWGGAKYQIDKDLVDAVIVPSSGSKKFVSPVPLPYGSSVSGEANGFNDGESLQLPPGVGADYVYTPYEARGWPYTQGLYNLPIDAGGFPGFGGNPSAINNLGQVVGSYWDQNYLTNYFVHGFIYIPRGAEKGYLTLDYPPESPCSFLTSINDAGWIVGVWQDTSQNNQICGNTTNPQHCLLWKPPYTSPPESFDNFGGVANCSQFDGLGSGPFINGIGQYAGAEAHGQMIDVTFGAGGPIFFDDPQANAPSLYDGINASVVIAASNSISYSAVGLNNNGQIAGNAENGQWVPYNQVGPIWESSGTGNNIFVDSDGVLYSYEQDPNGCGGFAGVNDEVQLMEGGCVIEALPQQ